MTNESTYSDEYLYLEIIKGDNYDAFETVPLKTIVSNYLIFGRSMSFSVFMVSGWTDNIAEIGGNGRLQVSALINN